MAFQKFHTLTLNLVFVLYLSAVITNVITMSGARELNSKDIPSNEKAMKVVEDPSNNKVLDKNQLPFGYPLPIPLSFPFPRAIPGLPLPFPIPIPGRMFPDMLIPPPEYNDIPRGVHVPSPPVPAPPSV